MYHDARPTRGMLYYLCSWGHYEQFHFASAWLVALLAHGVCLLATITLAACTTQKCEHPSWPFETVCVTIICFAAFAAMYICPLIILGLSLVISYITWALSHSAGITHLPWHRYVIWFGRCMEPRWPTRWPSRRNSV